MSNALVTYVIDSYGKGTQLNDVLEQDHIGGRQLIFNGAAIDKQEEITPGVPAIWEPTTLSPQQIIDKYKDYTSHFVFLGKFGLMTEFTGECLKAIEKSQGYYKVVYTDYKVKSLTMYMEPFVRWRIMAGTDMRFGPMLVDKTIFDQVKYDGDARKLIIDSSAFVMSAHVAQCLAYTNE